MIIGKILFHQFRMVLFCTKIEHLMQFQRSIPFLCPIIEDQSNHRDEFIIFLKAGKKFSRRKTGRMFFPFDPHLFRIFHAVIEHYFQRCSVMNGSLWFHRQQHQQSLILPVHDDIAVLLFYNIFPLSVLKTDCGCLRAGVKILRQDHGFSLK